MRAITPIVPGFDLPVTVYAENQPEYLQLPSYKADDGMVITRWKLTLRERLRLLWRGDLWLYVLTFNRSLQPVKLDTLPPTMSKQEGK
jgi:hypothetical protein